MVVRLDHYPFYAQDSTLVYAEGRNTLIVFSTTPGTGFESMLNSRMCDTTKLS